MNFHKKHLTHYTNKIDAIVFRENEATLMLPKGNGVELGALYWPTPLTEYHSVLYADIKTKEESLQFYEDKSPPLDQSPGMVDVDIIIDAESFKEKVPKDLDFFIASHVFEHTTHPAQFLLDSASILKKGGVAMITVPDAIKIYDRPRPRTRVTDFIFCVDSKRLEYIFYVEKIKNYKDSLKRLHEIKVTKEDPHLWTFDLSTIQPLLTDAFSYFEVPFKIKHICYNAMFEEINVFLEKI